MGFSNQRANRALLFSVLVHILILIWLARPIQHEPNRHSFEVLLQEPIAPTQNGMLDVPPRKSRNTKNNRLRKLRLSSLMPHHRYFQPPETNDQADLPLTTEHVRNWRESKAYDGNAIFSEAPLLTIDEIAFISSLWSTIDRHIEENPFLSEYNHTGNVYLRFEVDEKGQLIKESLETSAIDRVLKVIALRALRKALQNTNIAIREPKKRLWLHTRFSWRDYQACDLIRGTVDNYLSFCHYAENKRKTFSAGEKAKTWANAIYNHGPWAYEDIKDYNREEYRRKNQYDPFAIFERDPDWNL